MYTNFPYSFIHVTFNYGPQQGQGILQSEFQYQHQPCMAEFFSRILGQASCEVDKTLRSKPIRPMCTYHVLNRHQCPLLGDTSVHTLSIPI